MVLKLILKLVFRFLQKLVLETGFETSFESGLGGWRVDNWNGKNGSKKSHEKLWWRRTWAIAAGKIINDLTEVASDQILGIPDRWKNYWFAHKDQIKAIKTPHRWRIISSVPPSNSLANHLFQSFKNSTDLKLSLVFMNEHVRLEDPGIPEAFVADVTLEGAVDRIGVASEDVIFHSWLQNVSVVAFSTLKEAPGLRMFPLLIITRCDHKHYFFSFLFTGLLSKY